MYYSKRLYDSSQFYHLYDNFITWEQYLDTWSNCHVSSLPTHIYKCYKDKIEALEQTPGCIDVYFQMLNPTTEEKMEIINKDFSRHVNSCYKKNIYFGDKLEKLIFDADGNIRLFDEYLFLMIKYYTAKYNIIDIEATIAVLENEEKIKKGFYSNGVKTLVDAYMHESKVKFEIRKPYIIAHFGHALYHCPLECRFHAVFNENLQIFDCEINESEVLLNADGTFQYNALVYTENHGAKEIYIQFYDVEIEELRYKQECSNEEGF